MGHLKSNPIAKEEDRNLTWEWEGPFSTTKTLKNCIHI
jgi:hypothetical protein